jgi:hypothetical protein
LASEVAVVGFSYGGGDSDDAEPGIRRLNRIIASYDGHTHIYQFPDDLSWQAKNMVRLHVEEGTLHPYAGLVLYGMMRRAEDGG